MLALNLHPPGTPADIVMTASYPASCGNPITCNRPTSVTDARGYRTDYTYDATHGGVLTATRSAPSGAPPVGTGTRPQTRYTYGSFYAWYKNSSGNIVQGTAPVYKLTQTSTCATLASCTGTGDESRSTTAYQAGSASTASNILPLTVTTGAGNGSLSATTTTTYDQVGNVIAVDGPLAGDGDKAAYRYDALRRKTGEVAAAYTASDGQTKRRATRMTYHLNGQVQTAEQGAVAGLSDSDWSAFAPLTWSVNDFDALGRVIKTRQQNSAGIAAVTQFSYDTENRVVC
ncbi:MAG TPA: hypothetical protein VGC27_11405, partial [Rhizomicrobium sp.]